MPFLVCLIAIALLVGLAGFDVARRRLPGTLVGALALLYLVTAVLDHASLTSIAAHVGVALIAFAIGTALFAAGVLGGGDVKFAAAVFLWAGTAFALPAFELISVAGLVVTLVAVGAGRLVRRLPSGGIAAVASPWAATRGIPYGVAIASGALPIIAARVLAGGVAL
jgi:prepilin peptidase CpaA